MNAIALEEQTAGKFPPGSLLDSLSKRHTTRVFADRPLSSRHLSQLMWAAGGINRPEGGRTAPSAMGFRTIFIYAVTAQGVFLYLPQKNMLRLVAEGDFRDMAGSQDFVKDAPLSLALYADYDSFVTGDAEVDAVLKGNESRMSALDAGAVAENVYLYCASEGINVVERMMMDGEAFARKFGLPSSYHFQVAMSAGYAE